MATITAVVNLDLPGPTISRHVYGHFAEHLGRCIYGGFWLGEDSDVPNVRGIRRDDVDALRALGIPNLRRPRLALSAPLSAPRTPNPPCTRRRRSHGSHRAAWIGRRDRAPRMANSASADAAKADTPPTHESMDACQPKGAASYLSGYT